MKGDGVIGVRFIEDRRSVNLRASLPNSQQKPTVNSTKKLVATQNPYAVTWYNVTATGNRTAI